jgi:hypothetical protein
LLARRDLDADERALAATAITEALERTTQPGDVVQAVRAAMNAARLASIQRASASASAPLPPPADSTGGVEPTTSASDPRDWAIWQLIGPPLPIALPQQTPPPAPAPR